MTHQVRKLLKECSAIVLFPVEMYIILALLGTTFIGTAFGKYCWSQRVTLCLR